MATVFLNVAKYSLKKNVIDDLETDYTISYVG